MTPRPSRRWQWRRTENGTWTLSLGERGYRVRLFENREKGGMIYREVQLPGGKKSRCSLGTRDRDRAAELGRRLVGVLMAGNAVGASSIKAAPLRLGELCDRFVKESATFLDNTAKDQSDSRAKLTVVRAVFGEMRDVTTFSESDVRQFEARRRLGGIEYGGAAPTQPVRQRAVQADIKLLKQCLYWACSVTRPDGTRLLDRNPLQFVRVKGEHDVRRPVASVERFEATREAMRALQARYAEEVHTLANPRDRGRADRRYLSWVRAELALVLLEATGKRRSSIAGLRWTDFDFSTGRIIWAPEHDKKRKTWVVPYPSSLLDTVREFQRRLGAVGGYVFPRADGKQAIPRELISQWIRKAEIAAGLPKLAGGTTHPYRRKWRSERRHLPTKSVAVAGGWSDIATMETSYNVPDDEDLLAVTSEVFKRHEPVGRAGTATN